jgi:hypothetical protein
VKRIGLPAALEKKVLTYLTPGRRGRPKGEKYHDAALLKGTEWFLRTVTLPQTKNWMRQHGYPVMNRSTAMRFFARGYFNLYAEKNDPQATDVEALAKRFEDKLRKSGIKRLPLEKLLK